MNYQESLPAPQFRHIVKHFWSLEQSAAEALGEREPVLPDGCPEIVFNLADRFRRYAPDGTSVLQPRTLIAGQMTRHILIGPSGNVHLFGVRFHPIGAYCFLHTPMSEFTDRTDGLDMLSASGESLLAEHLLSVGTFEARIAVFESELAERLKLASLPDAKLTFAVDAFTRSGDRRVSHIAAELGWSERKLERDFAKYVGLSPKMFARVSRFASLVRATQEDGICTLADNAHAFGYYDQPHMINEFREFSGESPTAFYERSHRLSELFTTGE